jgi:hypothetical protein
MDTVHHAQLQCHVGGSGSSIERIKPDLPSGDISVREVGGGVHSTEEVLLEHYHPRVRAVAEQIVVEPLP